MSSGSESEGFGEFNAEVMGAAMAPEKIAPERVDLRGKSTIFA